jgi:small-conductance mechanosensitive channel
VIRTIFSSAVLIALIVGDAAAQQPASQPAPPITKPEAPITTPKGEEVTPAAQKVDVRPVARDEEIRRRLQNVLEATGWYDALRVRVNEGVVFLYGSTSKDDLKKWAGDLARNTQDVVAVVNKMDVAQPAIFDFSPAWQALWNLWRDFVRSLPLLLFALLVLALSVGIGLGASHLARWLLRNRIRTRLLLNVIARTAGVVVFLFGAYIILRVAGLTQLALSVVGGTGLVGLALGIAFRDISENFLASIFLSLQKPFQTGDFIEVAGVQGLVQQLNIRTTVLMTLEGHLLQVPNGAVYKSNIRNYSANWKLRQDFLIGIGYDDDIPLAQELVRKVLDEHPAVLNDPEPWVLVDGLGKSTVNLRIYFWFNGREHNDLKVRSSLIRLITAAFHEHGVTMPDESREVVFPHGVPLTVVRQGEAEPAPPVPRSTRFELPALDGKTVVTKAEAGLSSEAPEIQKQARQVEPLKHEENLLKNGAEPAKGQNSG